MVTSRINVTPENNSELQTENQPKETVEVIHEALIRNWGQLKEWMEADREFRIWQEKLRALRRQWVEMHRDQGLLLRGAALALAEEKLQDRQGEISQPEQEFILLSQKYQQRRRQRTIGGLIAGIVTVSLVAAVALWQWRRAVIGEENANMQAEIATLNSRFVSDKSLDSLIDGIRLGTKLNNENSLTADTLIRGAVLLQKMVYGVKEYNRLEGHRSSVSSVAFSPTEDLIVSGSLIGGVKLWKPDGTFVDDLTEISTSMVSNINFSHDGNLIAATSSRRFILWKKTGDKFELSQPWQGTSRSKLAIFNPKSNMIALSNRKGILELWDTKKGKLQKSFKEENSDSDVTNAAFSPNGKLIASADSQGIVRIWRTNGGKVVCPRISEGYVVDFTTKGKLITSAKKGIRLWDIKNCNLIYVLKDKILTSPGGDALAVSHKDDLVALASENSVKLWRFWKSNSRFVDRFVGRLVHTLQAHRNLVWGVGFNSKGDIVASASSDGNVKLWKYQGNPVSSLGEGYRVAFNPKSNQIGSVSSNGIKIWKPDGTPDGNLKGAGRWSRDIAFSPDGKLIASISEEGIIKIWKTQEHTELPLVEDCGDRFPSQTKTQLCQNSVTSIAFSPDSSLIATGSEDKTVIIWNIKDRKKRTLVHKLEEHKGKVTSLAFSPKGNLIASASEDADNTIKLWNSKDARLFRSLKGHGARVNQVIFSPNGDLVASASGIENSEHFQAKTVTDNTIRLWNPKNGDPVALPFIGHTNAVNSIAFHPKEKIIASASSDTTIKLWKLDGTLLATLEGHTSEIKSIAFSNDGKTIASADINSNVILWNLNLDDLLREGCDWVRDYLKNNPNVSDEERRLCGVQPSATAFLLRGEQLAFDGNIDGAVSAFQKALKLNPSLEFDPQTKAKKLAK